MTTIYKPVLIESAEQAEALPEGTIATDPDWWPIEKFQGRWENDADRFDHRQMVGFIALVPIEAEGEHVAPDAITYTRYVTAWEEA